MNDRSVAGGVLTSTPSRQRQVGSCELSRSSRMFSKTTQRVVTMVGVAVLGLHSVLAADVFEFKQDAERWKAAAPDWEGYAFDLDYPGCVTPSDPENRGCLVCEGTSRDCFDAATCGSHDPATLPSISGGTVTISAFTNDVTPDCSIRDSCTSCGFDSGSFISNGGMVVLEFDPPISAFYTYYGSLEIGATVTMTLYDQSGTMVDATTSDPSPHESAATGHGFVSTFLTSRIEFTSTATDSGTAIGTFVGLLDPANDTLGTVFFPPTGGQIPFDLGVVFGPSPDRVHNVTQGPRYFSITEAIDAAVTDDVLVAEPSVYHELVDFGGKAITLRSADPFDASVVAATVIDATGLGGSAVTCANQEGPGTVLDGFTITGGTGWDVGDGLFEGGGMYNLFSSPTVTRCTFVDNTANWGGGMYNGGASPTVTDCEFRNNSAIFDGAGMYNNSSSAQITDCLFEGNTAEGTAGGMQNLFGSVMVSGCTFTGNAANATQVGEGGGGMRNFGGTPSIFDCIFAVNRAGYGGGMLNDSESAPNVVDCTFVSNEAAVDGGGMYNDGASTTINDSVFLFNTAESSGGGMYNLESAPIVAGCRFLGNVSNASVIGEGGGGMCNFDSDPLVVICAFEANRAAYGGGMFNINFSAPRVFNGIFADNIASKLGGGMYNLASSPLFANCTSTRNAADADSRSGGGMYSYASSPRVSNCIFWDDTPDEFVSIKSINTIRFSNVSGMAARGAVAVDGNINVDPRFIGNSLRIGPGSPCIDAGDNTAPTSSLDFDLNPRWFDDVATPDTGNPDGARPIVDMGAFEFQTLYGDFDEDGAVKLDDHADLLNCLAGPDVVPPNALQQCLDIFDFDGDSDVDLQNFDLFQRAFGTALENGSSR